MDNALSKAVRDPDEAHARGHGWSRKMSDHIAYSLLVYTGLNIILTVGAIKGALEGSVLPYFSLVLLVAAIIPACRWLEHRWERLDRSGVEHDSLRGAFQRDRALVWIAAILLPVALTMLFKGLTAVI
jgi:hypothetical protein